MFMPEPNFLSRIQGQKDPGSASKILIIFNQKTFSKLSDTLYGMFIPDPDPAFSRIPHPGVKKADPDTQHW
jgi:hypothetical protein